MTLLNETFLRHEGSTDVITFDYSNAERGVRNVESNLARRNFICVDEAVLQAKQIQDELAVGNRPLHRPRRFAFARPRRFDSRRPPQDEARGKPPVAPACQEVFPRATWRVPLNSAREENRFLRAGAPVFLPDWYCAARRDHAGGGQMVLRHGFQLHGPAAVFSAENLTHESTTAPAPMIWYWSLLALLLAVAMLSRSSACWHAITSANG